MHFDADTELDTHCSLVTVLLSVNMRCSQCSECSLCCVCFSVVSVMRDIDHGTSNSVSVSVGDIPNSVVNKDDADNMNEELNDFAS